MRDRLSALPHDIVQLMCAYVVDDSVATRRVCVLRRACLAKVCRAFRRAVGSGDGERVRYDDAVEAARDVVCARNDGARDAYEWTCVGDVDYGFFGIDGETTDGVRLANVSSVHFFECFARQWSHVEYMSYGDAAGRFATCWRDDERVSSIDAMIADQTWTPGQSSTCVVALVGTRRRDGATLPVLVRLWKSSRMFDVFWADDGDDDRRVQQSHIGREITSALLVDMCVARVARLDRLDFLRGKNTS